MELKMKTNNTIKGIALTGLLLISTGASAGGVRDLISEVGNLIKGTGIKGSLSISCSNEKRKYEGEVKCLGITKRELVMIGLSVGIAFAVADYKIKLNQNSITISVPIK